MRLRLRHLRLRAETADGTYGADIPLKSGLNVLWGDNTKGKSTCLQGLLYVLGLERMLSPRREIPLTYVMTSHLKDDNGVEHAVLESAVWLEAENAAGEVITIRRPVKTEGSSKLVSLFDGPLLSQGGDWKQTDYWVLDPGAAKREHGFHRYLAHFVGWRLPIVRKFDNAETQLYVETLFPLFYVEQKAGWSTVPAAFPTFLQIRDVAQRAIEFVMALATHENELARQRIEIEKTEVKTLWTAKRDEMKSIGNGVGATLQGVATQPVIAKDEIERANLAVIGSAGAQSVRDLLNEARATASRLAEAEVPTIASVAPELTRELDAVSAKLTQLNSRRSEIFRNRQLEETQLQSVVQRLRSLDEDLQKNLDAKKLQTLGSVLAAATRDDHCPTCSQPIADALLVQDAISAVMSVDENISYLRGQIGLFKRVEQQSTRILGELTTELNVLGQEVVEASSRVRALRADLISPDSAPSSAAVEERLRLEARVRALQEVEQRFEEAKADLADIAIRFGALVSEEAALPTERLSARDRQKVERLATLIKDQAHQFGFGTFPAAEIEISEDTYRPQKEGFEFGFELSASDSIRLKWAYLLSLLELDAQKDIDTNHAGFVIFDEPRQQETKKPSFKELLKRASQSHDTGHQVVFATSEDRPELERFIKGVKCHYLAFDGYLIKKLDGPNVAPVDEVA